MVGEVLAMIVDNLFQITPVWFYLWFQFLSSRCWCIVICLIFMYIVFCGRQLGQNLKGVY